MRIRTVVVVLALLVLAAFAALNWPAFVAPTQLSLLFTTFEAPLGLLMLALCAILALAFAVYMAAWQGRILHETRQHSREMERQRTLAEEAEGSRFTELRETMRSEFERLAARVEQSQQQVAVEIRENANSLAAALAEMDDRQRRTPG